MRREDQWEVLSYQAEQLARRWGTSLECATRTLNKTEQRALRDWTRVQGDRRFRPTQLQLRYPRINCVMYCDVKYGPASLWKETRAWQFMRLSFSEQRLIHCQKRNMFHTR